MRIKVNVVMRYAFTCDIEIKKIMFKIKWTVLVHQVWNGPDNILKSLKY
jgi:hypothetical protein